ncbi:MAG: type II toxin-antitoxin system PemK/MazF family toxin, partial [Bacilli bacterium]|nr:type II toxin-antitoxin system PemK/MazF family toxin [Bacilli bacterium]
TSKNQMALCECILTISKEQIISYIKTLDEKTMKLIDRALSISLELEKEEIVLKH